MKGEVRSLKLKATLLKNKMAKNQEQSVTTFQAIQHVEDTITTPVHIGRLRIHMLKKLKLNIFKYCCRVSMVTERQMTNLHFVVLC